MTLRRHFCIPVLFAFIASSVARAQSATAWDSVWIWSASCQHAVRLRLEIQLDGRLLAAPRLSVCRVPATQAIGRSNTQRVSFTFHARHDFQGEYQTGLADTITADVWQAGADPKAVILGVSFSTTRQVLLNTIHILDPHERRRYVLDPGLASTSYPASRIE